MTKPDGIDQSWGFADPKTAKAAGIKVVSMYLSHDASKNVTAGKVKAYHAVGIGVLLNWEAQAGAPLLGAGQGAADARDAVALVKALIAAVGYKPGARLSIIFSCDRDTTSANYPKIDAYYGATKAAVHASGFFNGVYGEYDLVNHLHAKGLTDVEWQTYAWSGGRLSPEADFYQFHNGQKLGGADVDFDRIIHPSTLGAWMPPVKATPKPALSPEEDDMFIRFENAPTELGRESVFQVAAGGLIHVTATDYPDIGKPAVKVIKKRETSGYWGLPVIGSADPRK